MQGHRGAEGLLTKPLDFALLRKQIDTQTEASRVTLTLLSGLSRKLSIQGNFRS